MIRLDQLRSTKRLLMLGAHSDDIEIGAGGTLLRLVHELPELQLRSVVFSASADRAAEARRAFQQCVEGADGRCAIDLHSFHDARFPDQRPAIKDVFETLKDFQPDLVLTHTRDDAHQDHRTICELTWNTFRNHLILEYEIPKWDGDLGKPNAYVPLEPGVVKRKIDVLLSSFTSQRSKHWFDDETFRGLMRLRGLECNARYAEAFYLRKGCLL